MIKAKPVVVYKGVTVVLKRLSNATILHYTGKSTSICRNSGKKSASFAGVKQLSARFCRKCNGAVVADKYGKKKIKKSCQKCGADLHFQCLKCKSKYKTYSSLSEHIKTKCGFTIKYTCSLCDFTTTNKYHLQRHVVCVHPTTNTAVKCNKCGKKLKNVYCLKTHLQRCGVAPHLACDLCNYKAVHKGNLIRHLKWHESTLRISSLKVDDYNETIGEEITGVKQFIGRICPKCNGGVLADKYIKKKVKQSCYTCGTRFKFQCLKCKNKYKTYNSLAEHINTKCGFTIKYTCSLCDFTTTNKYRLRRHVVCVHPTTTTAVKCNKCGNQLKNINSLKTHLQHCGVAPQFSCHLCNHKAIRRCELRDHIKRHSSKISKTLPQGDKSDESVRQETKEYHKMIKRYCTKCEENVAYSEFRGRTMCPKCKSKLVFQCAKCGLELTNSERMFYHLQDKCAPEPSKCQKCNKVYGSIWKLRYHLAYCGMKFSCKYCPFKSKYRQNMKKHIKIVHLNQPDNCSSQEFKGYYKMVNRYCKNCEETIKPSEFRGKVACPKCKSKFTFQCGICNLDFTNYGKILYHMADKCAAKVSICQICGKKYPSYTKLKIHIRNCKKKAICCDYCPFQAKYKYQLINHINKHLTQTDITVNKNNPATGKDSNVDINNVKIERDLGLTDYDPSHVAAFESHGDLTIGQQQSLIKEELMLSESECSDNEEAAKLVSLK